MLIHARLPTRKQKKQNKTKQESLPICCLPVIERRHTHTHTHTHNLASCTLGMGYVKQQSLVPVTAGNAYCVQNGTGEKYRANFAKF